MSTATEAETIPLDGTNLSLKLSDIARFWSKVDRGDIHECWEWAEPPASGGYGAFWLNNTNLGAHTISCAMFHGPGFGRHALHACDNPPCVNPAHLRWGTPAENMADRGERDRTARGSGVSRAKLTEADVRVIRARKAAGEPLSSLARDFAVTKQAIAAIVNRRTWRHV